MMHLTEDRFAEARGPKVTIYTKSEIYGNVIAIRARLVNCGRRKYAQYDDAPFVEFVPKGGRKVQTIVQGYNPYMLIVDGWNTPEPASMFKAPEPSMTAGVAVQRARYRSFDDRFLQDCDNQLKSFGVKVLHDFRGYKA